MVRLERVFSYLYSLKGLGMFRGNCVLLLRVLVDFGSLLVKTTRPKAVKSRCKVGFGYELTPKSDHSTVSKHVYFVSPHSQLQ